MGKKVDFQNLKENCQKMVRLLEEIQTESGGHPTAGMHMCFHMVANEIRYELDGVESCVESVRQRAARENA
jgi:hypothetical protein